MPSPIPAPTIVAHPPPISGTRRFHAGKIGIFAILSAACVRADPPLPVTPLPARFVHLPVCVDDVRMAEEEGRPQLTSPRASIPDELRAALLRELSVRGFDTPPGDCAVHVRVLYAYGAVKSQIHGHVESDVAVCGRWVGRLVLARRQVEEDDVAADGARALTNALIDLLKEKEAC